MVLLGCLGAFVPLAVDMYLPGWPDVQRTLDTSASAVQLTLTTFLLGLAAGQLVAGPLSDRVGRRLPLLTGIAGFVVASVACALAPTIGALIVLRFVQGFAGGAGISVSRAIVRDLGDGELAARNFSLLILVNNLGPIVAPVVGGQLLHVTDWRGIFVVLAGAAAVLLAVAFRTVPETLKTGARTVGGLGAMGAALREVGRDRVFLGYAISSGFVFAALLAYIAGSSFVLQDIYGLSPQAFSLFFAANGLGLVAMTHVNGRLIGRLSPHALLLIGLGITTLGAAILVASRRGEHVGRRDPPRVLPHRHEPRVRAAERHDAGDGGPPARGRQRVGAARAAAVGRRRGRRAARRHRRDRDRGAARDRRRRARRRRLGRAAADPDAAAGAGRGDVSRLSGARTGRAGARRGA